MSLLEVRDLRREFVAPGAGWRGGVLRAVDGVSLDLDGGDCLALVGESGSGKTTLARCITRLIEPTSGSVRFRGADFLAWRGRRLRQERRFAQPVFQESAGALNPALRVGRALMEPILAHRLLSGDEARQRALELLHQVGLPASAFQRLPHEFSGGQRQRIGIARALAAAPQLLVADEPVSALDLSVRAQILSLFDDLRHREGLALLLIAHDLVAVSRLARRVIVLYQGRAVEEGPADAVLRRPLHPYSQVLRESAAFLRLGVSPRPPSSNEGLAEAAQSVGCSFFSRCAFRQPGCAARTPDLRRLDDERFVACHHPLDGD